MNRALNIRECFDAIHGIDKLEHYLPLYEFWMGKFVGKSPKILEIGVNFGGSAQLWRDFFGEGTQVVGVDADTSNARNKDADYMTLVHGDQGSEDFWDDFLTNYFDFDIIIDDGSHENSHQILTLVKTFNSLKDGGIYLCEDTHTSYYPNGIRVSNGGYKNPDSFIEYSKNIIDVLHEEHTRFAIGFGDFDGPKIPQNLLDVFRKTRGIHFYDSMVFIEKDLPYPFTRIKK